MGLLDLLFPKRCVNCRKIGSYLCDTCFTYLSYDPQIMCLMCNRPTWNSLTHPKCYTKYGIDGSFSVLAYNSVMKRLLFTYKYEPFVSDLHNLLSELFIEGLIQNEQFMQSKTSESVLVPVPLHIAKYRKRGYNHARLLARRVGNKLDLEVMDEVKRTRKTKSQFLLKKDDREENVAGAFALMDRNEWKQRTVFIVDDVVTTGATIKEITRLLKKAGVKKVYGLTLAHGH